MGNTMNIQLVQEDILEAGPSGQAVPPDQIHIEDEDVRRKEDITSSSSQKIKRRETFNIYFCPADFE